MPTKHPRKSPDDKDDSGLVKKRKKAEKKGWLKKSSRGSFHPPSDLSIQCCSQHIIVGCSCRFQLKNGPYNCQHIEWVALSQPDNVIWSNFVNGSQDLHFVECLQVPTAVAPELSPAPNATPVGSTID
eukprot:14353304-Ditylum_brightwellii.AAC.1